MPILRALFGALFGLVRPRLSLQLENLALRHQLAVLHRGRQRPRLTPADRLLWSWLSRSWPAWRDALVLVKPATVVAWQRKRFRAHWARRIRSGRTGRPAVSREIRALVRRMSSANPLWGTPRIQGELAKIGIDLARSTIDKYRGRSRRKPPSPGWRAFLRNHTTELVSVDFFIVPTVRFQVLFVFLVLAANRRRVLYFNVTTNPTAEWTARQIVQAFPWDTAPRYVLRDRDTIYAEDFRRCVRHLGITEVMISPRSPWQNPHVERLIGSIRHECLDHVVVLGEEHLRRLLRRYLSYYHHARTHLALDGDSPYTRAVHGVGRGNVVPIAEVGGLHHRYERWTVSAGNRTAAAA